MRIPFNVLDEAFVQIYDPVQPLTVQIEARVSGRLEDDRVRGALSTACGLHPLARARVLPWSDADPQLEWEVDDDPQLDPLRVIELDDEKGLDSVRAALQSVPVSLFESPPFRARLVHAPGGDVLMLAVHHAASDGMGCLRLLQSVLRAYAGLPDPTPGLDPSESHSLGFAAGRPSRAQWVRGAMLEMRKLRNLRSLPARVAPDGATQRAGYGIVTRRLPAATVVDSPLRSRLGASVNDVLLAALHLAIDRWNKEHGKRAERIAVHMPINARPAAWRSEVVGNLVTGETVSTERRDRGSSESCLEAVAGWTEAIKERGPEASLAVLASLPSFSVGAKQQAIVGAVTAGERLADTSVLSNVGRVPQDWIEGRELVVEEVWFSPPTGMPLGVGFGAAATDRWLCLSFRYRPTLLGADAAVSFADMVVNALGELSA